MKKYIYIAIAALMILMGIEIVVQDKKIDQLTDERDKYQANTEALLQDVKFFKVRDSLSAVQVGTLELTIKEFEKYRAQDAQLIKDLTKKNRDLTEVNKAQANTIIELQAQPKDTVLIVDSVKVDAKVVYCGDEWYTFKGIMTDNSFNGTLENKESILLTETVYYKRFLWWKTGKIKDRQFNAVSENPHTTMTNLEHIIIEK